MSKAVVKDTGGYGKKPTFKGETKAIEDYTFYYGWGMSDHCSISQEKILNWINRTYGKGERRSLENNSIDAGVTPPADMLQEAYDNLTVLEKERWKSKFKMYEVAEQTVEKNLGKLYSIIWGQCHIVLQNVIKADTDFDDSNTMVLWSIIERVCHSGTSKNSFVKHIDAMLAFHLISADSYGDLGQYADAFDRRYNRLVKTGWTFATEEFRDVLMKEMEDRGTTTAHPYPMLEQWQNGVSSDIAEKGRKYIEDKYKAHMFLRRSGKVYYDYRKKHENDYGEGRDYYADDATVVYQRLTDWKPPTRPPPATPVISTRLTRAATFLQTGERDPNWKKRITCFRCLEKGHLVHECTRTTKADGTPVNTTAQIAVLVANKKKVTAERQAAYEKKVATEAAANVHFQAEDDIIPSFDDMIISESEVDDYGFMVSSNVIDITLSKEHSYNQASSKGLRPFEILLDGQSTCDIIVNEAMVTNIRKCDTTLVLRCQIGIGRINEIADLHGVGTVWFYRDGVANILSKYRMVVYSMWDICYSTRTYRRTGDVRDLSYNCTTSEGVEIKFTPTIKGLHVFDASSYFQPGTGNGGFVFGEKIIDNGTSGGLNMMNTKIHGNTSFIETCHVGEGTSENVEDAIETIAKSEDKFSTRDVLRARKLRHFQHVSGHPSNATLVYSIATNNIRNYPFDRRDIKLMMEIIGESKYALEGKRTRRQPEAVDTEIMEVPPQILEYYKDVRLSFDVMHVNQIPFLVSISRNIHYGTAHVLSSMKIPVMENIMKKVVGSYRSRGFNVVMINVDIQFKPIEDRNTIPGVKINVCGRGEHIPEIERFLRVIKERARCYFAMLPYRWVPAIMIVHLIKTVLYYINAFVWRRGVSQILSPLTIMHGTKLDFNVDFPVVYGTFAHVYDGTDNTMKSRTTGAVALGPSGNVQGGVRFFSLTTSKILIRNKHDYNLLKYPDDAIKRVHYIARKQRGVRGLVFGNRANVNDNDNDFNPTQRTGVDGDDVTAGDQHVEQVIVDTELENDEAAAIAANRIEDTYHPYQNPQDGDGTGVDPENAEDEEVPILINNGSESESDSESSDDENNNDEDAYVTRSGRTSQPYVWDRGTSHFNQDVTGGRLIQTYYHDENLDEHLSDGLYYSDQFFTDDISIEETTIETNTYDKIESLEEDELQHYAEALVWLDYKFDEVTDLVFAAKQYSINAGVKKYGAEGKESAVKEINNLLKNECFGETDYDKLTQEQKDRALPILMFMILKRNGEIKTRGVANGSVQRLYTNKDDVTSPTPDYHSFKYVCAVAALEKRDVATIDLPGFFLQTEQEGEQILLKLTGSVAVLLAEMDPGKWKKHMRKENGRYVIYVVCNKAIYGTMNAALLAYKKLAKLLKDWGFVMNPYEPCLWNKMVGKHQLSMLFHIDDILMSHKKSEIVTLFIRKLEAEYGKLEALKICRGLVHEYLGQTLDFTVEGEVRLSQYDFIRKLWDTLPDSMKKGKRNTAAPPYLFKTDADNSEEDCELDDARQEDYHTITAKSLWLGQRSRPDMGLSVGYHCTRIKKATEYDWSKLGHLMQYMWTWRFLPLIIAIVGDRMIISIDGSHMVHADTKGHSGLFATMGKGAVINVAKKIGLVTSSSTETEIVSTGERINKCTWFRYMREAQGEQVREDLLLQDNKSCILLQKNYPFSVKKGSKHIHVRYFLTADKVERKELKILFCPTEEMTSDFNTKPLQGSKFEQFRNQLQGLSIADYDSYRHYYKKIMIEYKLFDDHENDLFPKT